MLLFPLFCYTFSSLPFIFLGLAFGRHKIGFATLLGFFQRINERSNSFKYNINQNTNSRSKTSNRPNKSSAPRVSLAPTNKLAITSTKAESIPITPSTIAITREINPSITQNHPMYNSVTTFYAI